MAEQTNPDSEKIAQEKEMAEGYKAMAEENRKFAIMVLPLAKEFLPK